MPVASHQIEGGTRVLLFTCEGCGGPAMFGTGCALNEAIASGDVDRAGRWFCGTDAAGRPCCTQTITAAPETYRETTAKPPTVPEPATGDAAQMVLL